MHQFILLVFLALTFITAGCASKKTTAQDQNPIEVTSRLDARLKQAIADRLDVLSPQNFQKAKDTLEDYKKSKNPEDAQTAASYLDRAYQVAKISKPALQSVLDARKVALSAGARERFAKEFDSLDQQLLSAGKDVENNDIDDATKKQSKLVSEYKRLASHAIASRYLGETRRLVQAIDVEEGDRWAPRATKDARDRLALAEAAIEKNPEDVQTISVLASNANKTAHDALEATRESKVLAGLNPEERYVVVKRLKDQLGSVKKEQSAAERSQDEQRRELSSLKEQTEKEKEQVQRQKEQVEQQAAHEKRFKEAEQMFSPDEANVYRRGNQLIVQLKSIDFDKGSAEIPSNSFEVLSRVGQVVDSFGPEAQVVVEGHTDSTGSMKKNRELSERRAHAVKDFLVNTHKELGPRVASRGLASAKPIASNKTPEGRKINRRVDIIIE